MLKKLNRVLNTIMSSFLGVFIGYSIYQYLDYKSNPGLYEMQSAPWYTNIKLYGQATLIILVIAIILKVLIKGRLRDIDS